MRRWSSVLLAAAFLLLPRAFAHAEARPLRLCADPDNLPFSSRDAATPGIYIEIGRAIAAALNRPFEPVWTLTYFGKHQVRTTLLAGKCDGFLGLPHDPDFMGPRVIFSKPVLDLGYALVTPRDAAAGSLDDLSSRRVAVQFASPPQGMVAGRTDIQAVTVLSPEEGMRDLAQGKADAAFIWGPSAGWLNQSEFGGRYQVVAAEGEHLRWQSAIGFRRDEASLRDAVDQALAGLGPKIGELRTKYAFPDAPQPVQHAAAAPAAPHAQAAAVSAGQVAAGHKLFNDNCSHCHGPDGVQGIRQRDLRLLHHRYGDDMDQVFMTTVTHGRMNKGMPNWSGILNDKQFHAILAYLHSLQE